MRFLFLNCFLLISLCFPVTAMQIDKMILVAKGSDSSDFYTISNNTKHPLFISSMVEELDISSNDVKSIKYTAENLNNWKVSVNPAKFILFPNQSKIVYVTENECINPSDCYREKDAVFAINLVPSVYTPEGEVPDNNVGVLFGFSPTFVIPSTEPRIDYDIDLVKNAEGKDAVKLHNKGNTFLTVMINQCKQDSEENNNCSTYSRIFSSRTGELVLPFNYEKGKLDIKVVSGLESYAKDYNF